MQDQWEKRERPERLERRYQFPDYRAVSDFLERAANLSEREGLYPDMGFGRDYVNVTIHTAEGADELDEARHRFAEELDTLTGTEGRG